MRKIPVPWTTPGEAVLYIVFALVAIGTVNIFSASFVMAAQELQDSYFFLKKHLLAFGLGFLGLTLAARLNYKNLIRILPLLIFITIGMLVAVYFGGIDANGARRWLKIGIVFQPSEIAKLVAVIMAAVYLGPRVERNKPVSFFSWPVVFSGIMGILVLKQPDMGTAVVIMAVCLILYLPSGIPRLQASGLVMGVVATVIYLVYATAYRAERILAWIDPWNYQQTSGYQAVQSLLAIGSGSFLGTGLGRGASKFLYLPEAHTDFAFAVLCQEMGFLGAAVVLGLFALLAWYGFKIALKASDGLGTMLAAGITLLIVGQAVGNIAMVTGVLPVTGVPLPFISFGGTSLIVNLVAVGVLISVGRRAGLPKARSGERRDKKVSRDLKLVSPNNDN